MYYYHIGVLGVMALGSMCLTQFSTWTLAKLALFAVLNVSVMLPMVDFIIFIIISV